METKSEKALEDPIHQLDTILEYMVYASYPDFDEEVHPFPDWIKTENLVFILEKITKDGYLKQSQSLKSENNPNNLITFEGILFYRAGGYKAEAKRKKLRRTIQNLKDWLLIVGSWVAAIAALCIVVIELFKHYLWSK